VNSIGETDARPAWFRRLDIWLATLSGLVLGFMMLFVVVGAVLRYVFNSPIPGGNEVLELASVATVMLALPYCTTQDAHIRIDLLDSLLGDIGRLVTELLYCVIGLIVLWFLVKSYAARTVEAYEYEDVTNMLDIPLWPFYTLTGFGMALYALILGIKLLIPIMTLFTRR